MVNRRQYPRLIPAPPMPVCLGESKSGVLLDLSEGGLAVDGFAPESRDEVIPIAFGLPEDNGYILAVAKIAWTSDSGRRAGLRFVDLVETSRQHLKDWMSARIDTAGLAAIEAEPAEPVFISHATDALIDQLKPAEVRLQLSSESEPEKPDVRDDARLKRYGKSRHLSGLSLAGVLLSSASVFSLAYYFDSIWKNRQAKQITAAPKVPSLPSKSSAAPVSQSPATTPSLPPTISPDLPGFVLQVGAMAHEDNADALAEALRQRNLPVFVSRRGTVRFYIVAVGPYSNADSAVTVKAELEGQGFQAILRRWSPE
ncbi:MAG: SPOR domain-containing protein [Candidatus Acidiferrales bacterium]